ncbi:MAG TPA: sugar isomerase domain-containing protein [Phycisphaerae bacterium]|jgi:uncharacterized phosphosugar-binding protein|nr:sugar isomerase domain-containing protein [Phycisphaerae bacterium]HOB73683.1 sugar isomerase domain-containing protein [Phycisphaerae bacterium]HOJ53443.1 sugar isomerase domain-containing protein [Phycisphaerae bacterium]HOL25433.1 sugar isomerase domain-containing protein [Phycisphaerae bacterium]HPP19890.1 sugar isomerase domain-containing protein [Phycisphaerae bacterium]
MATESSVIHEYRTRLQERMEWIEQTQAPAIEKGAEILAQATREDRLIHLIGTGVHSRLAAEDGFFRAGGLANINPIFALPMESGVRYVTAQEQRAEPVAALLDMYPLQAGDPLIVANLYGMNGFTIETLLQAAQRGLRVILLTSTACAREIPLDHPSRHPTKLNAADAPHEVLIDVPMPMGDALLRFEGCPFPVAPSSGVLLSFTLHALLATATQKLLAAGFDAPVIRSINTPDYGVSNARLWARYGGRVKHL